MPRQFKGLLLLLEIAAAVLLSSCISQLWDVGTPPYAITKPVYRIAGPDDVCSLGGIFFDFYNKSEKEVVFIETCMNVYNNQTGNLAFPGAGGLHSGASYIIKQTQTKNLCIPLDEYLCQLETTSLCVDNFFISKIEYADGSIWQDKTGAYANLCSKEV